MSDHKIGGVAETMLQTLYARAKESQKPDHKIYDAKAIEITSRMDYDFSAADRDTAMSSGVIARTIVIDRMVSEFVEEHPTAVVVNIACGMDTRFYRVDNGELRWYNIDLPVTMNVRKQYLSEPERVVNIAASAMDAVWAEQIPEAEIEKPVLVVIEGLTMYLSESDVQTMLSIISHKFPKVTVFVEILNPKFVKKNIEKSISQSGAVFTWGAKNGADVASICPEFRWICDYSLVEGMEVIAPIYKLIGKIGFIRNLSNKISVLEYHRKGEE